jgi:hypothetical protein
MRGSLSWADSVWVGLVMSKGLESTSYLVFDRFSMGRSCAWMLGLGATRPE